jgi:ABC-type Fe3+/spermidine/putrescine transport system ATPase subunit
MAVMNAGEIEQTGAPQELYQRPATRFVASFLGAMNWINGCGVRPEATRLSRQLPQNTARACRGAVSQSTFLGAHTHIEVNLEGGEAVVAQTVPADGAFQPGEAVHVWWSPDDELRLP